ncbi:hypothetical protein [Streptomyces sp. NPDC058745]|uniref:hypothetical protein n=1 Tax=Streptomyces sp. NPDC058745 TaxID=3346621 RepID=UPI0036BDAE66
METAGAQANCRSGSSMPKEHLEDALHAAVDGGEFHVDRDLALRVQPVDDLVQERDQHVLVPLRPYFHVPPADSRRPRQVRE